MHDEVLVRRAAIGDRGAFAEIVERHGPALHRYTRRLLHDDGVTEDCVQETFLSAWRGLPRYRGDAAPRVCCADTDSGYVSTSSCSSGRR